MSHAAELHIIPQGSHGACCSGIRDALNARTAHFDWNIEGYLIPYPRICGGRPYTLYPISYTLLPISERLIRAGTECPEPTPYPKQMRQSDI